MYIKKIEIKNFRGIDLNISNFENNFLIIGKNDSGKSNFCYAIRKVLNYNERKKPLLETDSSNSNKEEILINITLYLENISTNNRAILGAYIDQDDINGAESLTVSLKCIFNEFTQSYDEYIYFGTKDTSEEKPAWRENELDKVLELIYVYPNYDLVRDTKNYFNYHKSKNDEDLPIGTNIINAVDNLNNEISNDMVVKNMQLELSQSNSMGEIFENFSFEIKSDIDISNIFKSLKIMPTLNNKNITNIGDGRTKLLSLLLQKLTKDSEKEKIILLEEPENNLFPLLQKEYSSIIENFHFGQTIITTHSSNIIDFRKTKQIFKFQFILDGDFKIFKYYFTSINSNDIYKNFGYALNQEIAESFFYDQVLLIEGYSERLFYNTLINTDENFRKKILKESVGFVSVYSTDFFPSKTILESLGIKVHILTDNDLIGVKGNPLKHRYAGIQRAIKLLKTEELKDFYLKFDRTLNNDFFNVEINSEQDNYIKKNIQQIIEELKARGIYLHRNLHNGFEEAFIDFIGINENKRDEVLIYLKKRKMKALHAFILKNKIQISVNKTNKNNILVDFLYGN